MVIDMTDSSATYTSRLHANGIAEKSYYRNLRQIRFSRYSINGSDAGGPIATDEYSFKTED